LTSFTFEQHRTEQVGADVAKIERSRYDTCSREDQRKQEVSACAPRPHFGLNPKQGRGAPEIDLLEVMPGNDWLWTAKPLKKPYHSTSLQLAPAARVRPFNGAPPLPGQWYEGMEYGPNTCVPARAPSARAGGRQRT
jgi:hypothetical protein